jgi:hypothetical protein
LASQLAALFPNSASLIAVGISWTDVQYADDVTAAVVKINASTQRNAAVIAGAVTAILPAEEACEVSNVLGGLIHAGTLKVSQASPIASAIATSLVKNSLKLNTDLAIQEELQVVAAQMMGQLLKGYIPSTPPADLLTTAANKRIIAAIAAVAKSVAAVDYKKYAVKTTILPLATDPGYAAAANLLSGYANQVAGSSAQEVILHGLPSSDRDLILLAILKAVKSVTSAAGDLQVATAVNNARNPSSGIDYLTECLNEQETPVTNY